MMITRQQVLEKLKECFDPEIPLNIVDLGLIYDIDITEDRVKVRMTLTSPGCPLHSSITQSVQRKIEEIEGIQQARVEVVWEPRWTPERMSPEARKKLGWPERP